VPGTVDDYIAAAPAEMRPGLELLRKLIRAAAPKGEEGISYGVPAYKYYGMLIFFGAAKNHLALYGAVPPRFERELAAYDTSKGTIRLSPDRPIPAALVKKLVSARVAQNEENERRRKAKNTRSRGK
jgi:uncharacterized protein YdhG (YjbR/CyaY superfamily)